MKQILILGGSGNLGSSLVYECKLRNISYLAPGSSVLDITNKNEIQQYFSTHKPYAIVNCAAWTDVENSEIEFEKAFGINADSVRNLALTAKQEDIPIIHISTDYVFDGTKKSEYSETDSTSPVNVYGVSKLQGEQYLLEAFPEKAYIIRTSWLYGISGRNFVKTVAKKALARERIQVVSDQVGTPTNSEDLARGILELLEKNPQVGIYNFCNTGQISWYTFAAKIYELAGADTELVNCLKSTAYSSKVKRPANSALSTDKWSGAQISELDSWDASLSKVFPRIVTSIKKESSL